MAIFNSYSGGPHGMGAMQLPEKPGILGEIGKAMGAVGGIPAQMQQAQLKNALTDLLLQSLTTPQTIDQTVPGQITYNSGDAITSDPEGGSFGEIFTESPSKTVKGPNPKYTDVMNRLESVGPAFGMKFPTSGEDKYYNTMAKIAGQQDLARTRGEETRKTNEALYGGNKLTLEDKKQENKSTYEDQRQGNREKSLEMNITSREKIAGEYNKTRESIAKDNRTSIEDRANKLLIENSRHHRASEENYGERTKAIKSSTNNMDEIRVFQQINQFQDNLRSTRAQIDKIRQLDSSDPEIAAQQKTAIEEYNNTVDKIKQLDPGANLSKYDDTATKSGAMNWLRSLGLPGFNQPEKAIGVKPSGNPPPKPATTKPKETEDERLKRLLRR